MSQEEEEEEEGQSKGKHSHFPTNNCENMKLEMLEAAQVFPVETFSLQGGKTRHTAGNRSVTVETLQ